ncbi:uncharacterized protein SCDLUD_003947 [Saccharomycodes ludwigii]|uniref:uncharacterized protein n=1 Tax=Saccharomycodes ludwigii TaxID=36035 RepID=UPI001E8457A2|nr:hypothetical protein SCDLUD_003947 [Saccharomycodes ludwigii]KAH3899664.1 hypothetical protein SCDLUD_003947 [Saccharomycodes ludwigii]
MPQPNKTINTNICPIELLQTLLYDIRHKFNSNDTINFEKINQLINSIRLIKSDVSDSNTTYDTSLQHFIDIPLISFTNFIFQNNTESQTKNSLLAENFSSYLLSLSYIYKLVLNSANTTTLSLFDCTFAKLWNDLNYSTIDVSACHDYIHNDLIACSPTIVQQLKKNSFASTTNNATANSNFFLLSSKELGCDQELVELTTVNNLYVQNRVTSTGFVICQYKSVTQNDSYYIYPLSKKNVVEFMNDLLNNNNNLSDFLVQSNTADASSSTSNIGKRIMFPVFNRNALAEISINDDNKSINFSIGEDSNTINIELVYYDGNLKQWEKLWKPFFSATNSVRCMDNLIASTTKNINSSSSGSLPGLGIFSHSCENILCNVDTEGFQDNNDDLISVISDLKDITLKNIKASVKDNKLGSNNTEKTNNSNRKSSVKGGSIGNVASDFKFIKSIDFYNLKSKSSSLFNLFTHNDNSSDTSLNNSTKNNSRLIKNISAKPDIKIINDEPNDDNDDDDIFENVDLENITVRQHVLTDNYRNNSDSNSIKDKNDNSSSNDETTYSFSMTNSNTLTSMSSTETEEACANTIVVSKTKVRLHVFENNKAWVPKSTGYIEIQHNPIKYSNKLTVTYYNFIFDSKSNNLNLQLLANKSNIYRIGNSGIYLYHHKSQTYYLFEFKNTELADSVYKILQQK